MNVSFRFIFNLSMLLSFLNSMYAWFFWHINTAYIGLVVSIFVCFYIIIESVKLKFSYTKIIGIILLMLSYYIGYPKDFNTIIGKVFILFPIIALIHIEDEEIHKGLLNFTANFFAILLPISLVVFWLSHAGLPVIKEIPPPTFKYGSDFRCYIFAIQSNFYGIRFSSIFLEPGHLGMILAYLLYALKFNLKDIRVIIIGISILFTMSLAAYVLTILAFVLTLYANKKLKIRYVVSAILFFIFLYIVAVNYKDGDNYLYEYFFQRLEFSEDKLIAGNNRTYGMFDDFYELAMEHKNLLLWGIGVDNFLVLFENAHFGGAGIKVFVLKQGVVALMFVFLGYILIGSSIIAKNSRRYLIGFIILYAASFLQRAYPFWTSWLILFIVGLQSSGQTILKNGEKY